MQLSWRLGHWQTKLTFLRGVNPHRMCPILERQRSWQKYIFERRGVKLELSWHYLNLWMWHVGRRRRDKVNLSISWALFESTFHIDIRGVQLPFIDEKSKWWISLQEFMECQNFVQNKWMHIISEERERKLIQRWSTKWLMIEVMDVNVSSRFFRRGV